jgi:hypothetical protein
MKNFSILFLTVLIFLSFILIGCNSQKKTEEIKINSLSDQENKEGWKLIFDGNTFSGWRGLGRETVPEGHWIIEDNCIRKVKSGEVPLQSDGQPLQGGDLITTETYENFEFTFEWKISEGGNSGIKYNVSEDMSTSNPPQSAALGFEYQVLDDENHADGVDPTHRSASLYDMIPPENKALKPVGEFNQSRIVFNKNLGEHWLNGTKVLEYNLSTTQFDSLLAASKYKIYPGFGDKRKGHLVLQDHTDDVWYRNLKIKVLN